MKVLHCLVAGAATAALGCLGVAQAATLTISCPSGGRDYAACKLHTQQWEEDTGHTVIIRGMPSSANDTLAELRRLFAAKSDKPDVVSIDVVWPGVLKSHLLDLRPYSHGAEKEHFPAIVANNTVDEKLLAMPAFTAVGLLYYRTDLLKKYGLQVPSTWEALRAAAGKIQAGERAAGAKEFHGFVFQGKDYEGLTCNLVEWVASFGGQIFDAQGRITVDSPATVQALRMAASWPGTIAPRNVLDYGENDALGVFQKGHAAFMRSWPDAWASAQEPSSAVKDKVGVAPLPRDGSEGRHATTLGGGQYAVSRYSKHPALAAALVMFLTSREVQKENAVQYSFHPTRPDLYGDQAVVNAHPFTEQLLKVLPNAVLRPSAISGPEYPMVSEALSEVAHDVMSGKFSAEEGARRLKRHLEWIIPGLRTR